MSVGLRISMPFASQKHFSFEADIVLFPNADLLDRCRLIVPPPPSSYKPPREAKGTDSYVFNCHVKHDLHIFYPKGLHHPLAGRGVAPFLLFCFLGVHHDYQERASPHCHR